MGASSAHRSGLIFDAWTVDEIIVKRERRRRPRRERNRGGEAAIGLGVLGMAAAFIGRDTWPYTVVSVIAGSVLLLYGVFRNRAYLRDDHQRGSPRRTEQPRQTPTGGKSIGVSANRRRSDPPGVADDLPASPVRRRPTSETGRAIFACMSSPPTHSRHHHSRRPPQRPYRHGRRRQVTVGETVMKSHAQKVRATRGGKVLAGFAGAVADAMTCSRSSRKNWSGIREIFRAPPSSWRKDWRSDRVLRPPRGDARRRRQGARLPDLGTGELIEPDDGILAIGSGGSYALAAARALLENTELDAKAIVERGLRIAGEICVYSNTNITV
jgi:ATP-dependent HslUV protease subunit HslV